VPLIVLDLHSREFRIASRDKLRMLYSLTNRLVSKISKELCVCGQIFI
jgi:hypothetical protein